MSQQRAAGGPGYFKPLSDAQVRALRIIDINGDIRYHSTSLYMRRSTVDSLIRLGLLEHCELPVGSGHETRAAVRLTALAFVIRSQWSDASKDKKR